MDDATAGFTEHKEVLFSLAYRLLGSVADTEDVLQETWLAWAGTDRGNIANPRAYLVRTAVNHALGRLRRARNRREIYVGPWLPEPLITGPDVADAVERAEDVSMALMVLLESLTPLERAVFVLNEAFGYGHYEIASMVGRSPAAVRQIARRAREHLRARRPRYKPAPDVRRAATERFLTAALGGDLAGLMDVLAPDVTMWTDGGGKTRTATLRPIRGRDKVARLLAAVADRHPGGLDVNYRRVNGDPGAVLFTSDALYAILVVELTPDGDRISDVFTVTNPDKLRTGGKPSL